MTTKVKDKQLRGSYKERPFPTIKSITAGDNVELVNDGNGNITINLTPPTTPSAGDFISGTFTTSASGIVAYFAESGIGSLNGVSGIVDFEVQGNTDGYYIQEISSREGPPPFFPQSLLLKIVSRTGEPLLGQNAFASFVVDGDVYSTANADEFYSPSSPDSTNGQVSYWRWNSSVPLSNATQYSFELRESNSGV